IEYTAVAELPMRRAEQRRVQLVVRLLEGGRTDREELGYDPEQWHLGVIVSDASLEQAVARIAARAHAEVLTVAAETSTLWMWIGASSSPVAIRDELAAQDPAGAATLAIGEPEAGVAGFRQTYRQAQVAAAIGDRLGRSVTRYADVALEDLAATNRERAAEFLDRELGPLGADTREAKTLRETLVAYFTCSQRASSAAAQLGVHERTIGNRLRRVEQLTGQPALARALELQVALRLHDLIVER
ncbi:MAG: helix-turn-helix domain-containing protein, partial [Solirubrobacteraceae bacterium]